MSMQNARVTKAKDEAPIQISTKVAPATKEWLEDYASSQMRDMSKQIEFWIEEKRAEIAATKADILEKR